MRSLPVTIALTLAISGAAIAHTGVQDPQVKAWMDNMKSIADETKTIGKMARGLEPFDAAAANAALRNLEVHAAEIPALFQAPASDPLSEALPAIWTDPAPFIQAAESLADAAAREVVTLDDLRGAMGPIAESCKACHGRYRE